MIIKTSFKGFDENDGSKILEVREERYSDGEPGLSIETKANDVGGVLVTVSEVTDLRDFFTAWLDRVAAEAKS